MTLSSTASFLSRSRRNGSREAARSRKRCSSMFIGRGRAKGGLAQRAHGRLKRALARRAFTLLEIMLAVGILGLMSLAIFRFVQSNLTSLRLSSDISAADAQYDGLRALLAAEWQSLPPQRAQPVILRIGCANI